MIVSYRVVSLAFKDQPDWQVLNDDVPIGKVYHILDSTIQTCVMFDKPTGRRRAVTAGVDTETRCMIPLDTMELIES